MNRSTAISALALIAGLASVHDASAQNIVVSGARIITGTGQVIEKGAVVVKDGKIVS
jgi:predicted amidohydrolase YtcJ